MMPTNDVTGDFIVNPLMSGGNKRLYVLKQTCS